MQKHELIVPDADANARLDSWLASVVPDITRSGIQKLITDGLITVDGVAAKGSRKTRPGEKIVVTIPPPTATTLEPEQIPIEIIHEDRDIIVVNKPAGMVVHPSAGHYTGTLVNALLYHCKNLPGISGTIRPGIVHRLDMNTTGALVVAKTDRSAYSLAEQFASRKVQKKYLALVHGVPSKSSASVETLIGRHESDRKRMSVKTRRGREALTRYEIIEKFNTSAMLSVEIKTGRTHQIRVHMAHISLPIIGDKEYGSRKADASLPFKTNRQMLHAWKIRFIHPGSCENVEFCARIPRDMEDAIEHLRQYSLPFFQACKSQYLSLNLL